MTRHELKIWPDFFADVTSGAKKYEVRKNDRPFAVGDELFLREYNPASDHYSGRTCTVKVVHLTRATDLERIKLLPADVVVMGIDLIA